MKKGNITKQKSIALIEVDLSIAGLPYDPTHISAAMIYRIAVGMGIRHNVVMGSTLGYFDFTTSYLHEPYSYTKHVYV